MSNKVSISLGSGIVFVLTMIMVLMFALEKVNPGYEAVGVRFGKVTGKVLDPGLHLVNPLVDWDHFNTLQRTALFDQIQVPASDQQTATMDVSIQFRILPGAPLVLRKDTGVQKQVESVHFVPIVRGALRDAGRSTKRVEDFFNEQAITKYRSTAMQIITQELEPRGFEISDVIVRDVRLPEVITAAIQSKKQREQEVEKERAELERVALAAQQKVRQAQADKDAALEKAEAIKTLANAEAYKIEKLQQQLAKSPNYVELVKAEKWNGSLPKFTGGVIPFLNVAEDK